MHVYEIYILTFIFLYINLRLPLFSNHTNTNDAPVICNPAPPTTPKISGDLDFWTFKNPGNRHIPDFFGARTK
jgi:hypothetical protein